jgi:hypothetical protein
MWQLWSSGAILKEEMRWLINVNIFKQFFHHCVSPAVKQSQLSSELNSVPIQVNALNMKTWMWRVQKHCQCCKSISGGYFIWLQIHKTFKGRALKKKTNQPFYQYVTRGCHGCSCCTFRWGETMSPKFSHRLAYCSSPRWYMNTNAGGMILTEKTEELEENSVPVPLHQSNKNPTWTYQGANPGLCSERPTTSLAMERPLMTQLTIKVQYEDLCYVSSTFCYASGTLCYVSGTLFLQWHPMLWQ